MGNQSQKIRDRCAEFTARIRFGREGLVPRVMLDHVTSEDESCSSFGFSMRYTDELHNLLWLSARPPNAVGKKPSLKDVVAAVALKRAWMNELAANEITPRRLLKMCHVADLLGLN